MTTANKTNDHESGKTTAAPEKSAGDTMRESFKQRMKEQAEDDKRADDIAYRRATGGDMTDDLRDRILALGGDATRSSPAIEQVLPSDIQPGLTTTTGAYRTPIDPTTAAVPADEDSNIVLRMKGYPTVGSGRKSGTPEERYKEPEDMPHDSNDKKKEPVAKAHA